MSGITDEIGAGPVSHLNRKKINELWKLYQEDQRPSSIAKKAGIHYLTVKKYITVGDQKNGIEPFANRMKRITDKVDEKIVIDATKDIEIVQRVLNAAFRDIFKIEKKNGKDVIVGLNEAAKIGDIDKLLRLKYFLSGEPDSRNEIRIKGEVNQVISAVISIISKHVKDQSVKNLIADELVSLVDLKGDSGGSKESGFTH